MPPVRRAGLAVPRVGPTTLATTVVVGALVAWILTAREMRGMDAGPATDLGELGWYVGAWVTMMAAMMLPSVAPMALVFARVSGQRRGGDGFLPTCVFLCGYLVAWTAYGLAAYGVYSGVRSADWGFLAWDRQGPAAAGAAVGVAGIYELTPLKRACLRHCRSPVHFLLHSWRPGRLGALRMGLEHGIVCVGCCVGLMVVLFAVGVMSVFWMAVVATVIFAEKVLPIPRLGLGVAVLLAALGAWIATDPGGVPMLRDPGTMKMPPASRTDPATKPAPNDPMASMPAGVNDVRARVRR